MLRVDLRWFTGCYPSSYEKDHPKDQWGPWEHDFLRCLERFMGKCDRVIEVRACLILRPARESSRLACGVGLRAGRCNSAGIDDSKSQGKGRRQKSI